MFVAAALEPTSNVKMTTMLDNAKTTQDNAKRSTTGAEQACNSYKGLPPQQIPAQFKEKVLAPPHM